MPTLASAASNDSVNWPRAVADQEPEVGGAVAEVHQQVADLLGGPRAVRVRGHAEDVHVAGADFHHEEAVQALEGHCAVHVEEVDGEHRGGLCVQELPPGRIGAPLRCRRDPQGLENPADRGCADPVAELEQFALDSLVSPAMVLDGEPLDERGDLGADRRPTPPMRVGPLPGDEASVPPQDGAWVTRRYARSFPGRSLISAARTARSAQSSRGRGLMRRSTATSCRSTSSSTFLEVGGRPNRTSQPQSRTNIR